ncbi:MAG: imelysin family protein [Pseudomonadota bacterium]
MNKFLLGMLCASFLLVGCEGDDGATGPAGATGAAGATGPAGPAGPASTSVSRTDVVTTNANIAYASYSDSWVLAIALEGAIDDLVADPTQENFDAAKAAWLAVNEPYGQTEVYRFRVGPIDALLPDGSLGQEGDGPEGAINAWPLGEALIDYVAAAVDGDSGPEIPNSTNSVTGNIISDTTFTIDSANLRANNELGGDERNLTTGFHAIEFLLWGQDLNADLSGTGTRDSSGGQRPVSDYQTGASCTSGLANSQPSVICERRGLYLQTVAEILVEDLKTLVDAWNPNGTGNHYANFVAGGDTSLAKILEGMGRLGFGELAGERMNIALLTNSQEDEHSCFSDNTHRDIVTNAMGIENSYFGTYTRIDGSVVAGAGVHDLLISEGFFETANAFRSALETTMIRISTIDDMAKAGMPFDTQIQLGINEPNISGSIQALSAQTDVLETVITDLGVTVGDLRQDTEEDI